jgi:hypothetical protein
MTATSYPLAPDPSVEWGGAKRRYDIVKEGVIALVVVAVLAVGFSLAFSSPDLKPVTVAGWAQADPQDFLTTALSELDGTSGLATYGPPYDNVAGAGQNIIAGFSIERLIGVQIPIDTANAFVLEPLSIPARTSPVLRLALAVYGHATAAEKQRWTTAFGKALAAARFRRGALVGSFPSGRYGPVPVLMANLLEMGLSGALDGALISTSRFYQTNFTKALLFLADGTYLSALAAREHLLGGEWGMMNETGNYPGQAWLWLYTFFYQIPPFSTSTNADAQIWAIMALLSLALICVPFLPGVRSLPRLTRVYRLIWRDYYRVAEGRGASAPPAPPPPA